MLEVQFTIFMDVTTFSLVDKFRQFTIFLFQRRCPAYVERTCDFVE
jgi:hypothetical protein